MADVKKISSEIKSWLFADQLEYPEEIILYRKRSDGGLSLLHVKYKAMAAMARSFFKTSLNPKFITNLHHHALYLWQVEDRRDIPDPGRNPYMTEELWAIIRHVKDEGLLNMSRMITGE